MCLIVKIMLFVFEFCCGLLFMKLCRLSVWWFILFGVMSQGLVGLNLKVILFLDYCLLDMVIWKLCLEMLFVVMNLVMCVIDFFGEFRQVVCLLIMMFSLIFQFVFLLLCGIVMVLFGLMIVFGVLRNRIGMVGGLELDLVVWVVQFMLMQIIVFGWVMGVLMCIVVVFGSLGSFLVLWVVVIWVMKLFFRNLLFILDVIGWRLRQWLFFMRMGIFVLGVLSCVNFMFFLIGWVVVMLWLVLLIVQILDVYILRDLYGGDICVWRGICELYCCF